MNDRCPNYCGLTCVDGSCPNALADEYPEYGYEHCNVKSGYYKVLQRTVVLKVIQNIVLSS